MEFRRHVFHGIRIGGGERGALPRLGKNSFWPAGSSEGAAGIWDKLAKLGIIVKTADYVPNKTAARFKWLAQDGSLLAEPESSENPF
jgi:hypothetical protein